MGMGETPPEEVPRREGTAAPCLLMLETEKASDHTQGPGSLFPEWLAPAPTVGSESFHVDGDLCGPRGEHH